MQPPVPTAGASRNFRNHHRGLSFHVPAAGIMKATGGNGLLRSRYTQLHKCTNNTQLHDDDDD